MATKLFLQNFTVLDFAFLCPEKGLQGESFHVSATLSGDLDHQGFVMDFGRVKKLLKTKVDELLDHRLVVPEKMPELTLLKGANTKLSLRATTSKEWEYQAPREAFVFLAGQEKISINAIQNFLVETIQPFLPENVHSLQFTVTEEAQFHQEANFRYTHGLRFHDGNCQRLFHGHRNLVEVFVDQVKSPALERELAALFADIHFANACTVNNLATLDLGIETREFRHPGKAQIEYHSAQGVFQASLPASQLMLLECEPSIENIAAMAKRYLETKHKGKNISVMAYEGLNKGSFVE